MIYISNNNILIRWDKICISSIIKSVFNNDTGYLPVRTYNNVLLMSDSKLYTIMYDNKLSILCLKQNDNYVIDSTEFTDKFAKINTEYYEICGLWLFKIPIIANNPHNIKRTAYGSDNYYYYYVSINNELVVFDVTHKSMQFKILDDGVSLILYHDNRNNHCIIYVKNNIIIYSDISNFTQLTNHYVIDHIGQLIIKTSDGLILDSHNDLYQLIDDDKKFILKKISSDVVDFYCDVLCAYVIDTESKIHCIGKYNYSRKYIGVGHFGKKFNNIKSANNIYIKT